MIISRFIILAGTGWANFSPVIVMSLFAGYYFTLSEALLVTFIGVTLSNIVVNNTFYSQWFDGFSWGINVHTVLFLCITLMTRVIKNKIASNIISVLFFFICSNFLVYLTGQYGYG